MQKINIFCTTTSCIWFSLVGLLIIRNISGNATTTTALQIIRFFIIKIVILLLLEISIILVFVIPVFLVTAASIKVSSCSIAFFIKIFIVFLLISSYLLYAHYRTFWIFISILFIFYALYNFRYYLLVLTFYFILVIDIFFKKGSIFFSVFPSHFFFFVI